MPQKRKTYIVESTIADSFSEYCQQNGYAKAKTLEKLMLAFVKHGNSLLNDN